MYSRQRDGSDDISVPPNYSGNAFRQRRANVHITPERRSQTPRYEQERRDIRQLQSTVDDKDDKKEIFEEKVMPEQEQIQDTQEEATTEAPQQEAAPASLLSPLGSLGTEEILLIALALIIFQSGKEPDLALILLALLFVN